MEKLIIRDQNGNKISESKNLAGIRRYVATNTIKILAIDSIDSCAGKLVILFDNKASFECNFASFNVLRNFVRNWRNVYDSPLLVQGNDAGKVSYDNTWLV